MRPNTPTGRRSSFTRVCAYRNYVGPRAFGRSIGQQNQSAHTVNVVGEDLESKDVSYAVREEGRVAVLTSVILQKRDQAYELYLQL